MKTESNTNTGRRIEKKKNSKNIIATVVTVAFCAAAFGGVLYSIIASACRRIKRRV